MTKMTRDLSQGAQEEGLSEEDAEAYARDALAEDKTVAAKQQAAHRVAEITSDSYTRSGPWARRSRD